MGILNGEIGRLDGFRMYETFPNLSNDMIDTPDEEYLEALMLGEWDEEFYGTQKQAVPINRHNGKIYHLDNHTHREDPVLDHFESAALYGVSILKPDHMAIIKKCIS